MSGLEAQTETSCTATKADDPSVGWADVDFALYGLETSTSASNKRKAEEDLSYDRSKRTSGRRQLSGSRQCRSCSKEDTDGTDDDWSGSKVYPGAWLCPDCRPAEVVRIGLKVELPFTGVHFFDSINIPWSDNILRKCADCHFMESPKQEKQRAPVWYGFPDNKIRCQFCLKCSRCRYGHPDLVGDLRHHPTEPSDLLCANCLGYWEKYGCERPQANIDRWAALYLK